MNPKKLKSCEMPAGECIEFLYDCCLIGYAIKFGTKTHAGWSAWRIDDHNTSGIRLLNHGTKSEALAAIAESLKGWA